MPGSLRFVQSVSASNVTRAGPPQWGSKWTVHGPATVRSVRGTAKLAGEVAGGRCGTGVAGAKTTKPLPSGSNRIGMDVTHHWGAPVARNRQTVSTTCGWVLATKYRSDAWASPAKRRWTNRMGASASKSGGTPMPDRTAAVTA
jgi:hypothetical protein